MQVLLALIMLSAVTYGKPYLMATSSKIADAKCFLDKTLWVIIRAYTPVGMVDPNLKHNINALNDGGAIWEPYMMPCFKCGNPKKQIKDMKVALAPWNGQVPVYVVPSSWGTNIEENRKFMTELIDELTADGTFSAAVVTSIAFYEKTFGKDWGEFSRVPLVYIGTNNDPSCNDFRPFGGWKESSEKMYSLNQDVCGVVADYIGLCHARIANYANAVN